VTHATKPQLTCPGDLITFTAGRHTITAQYVRRGAFSVTVYQGAYRVDTLCASYAVAFLARGTADQARQQALYEVQTERVDQTGRPYPERAFLADLDRAIDFHTTDAERAEQAAALAELAASLGPARTFREIRDRHAAALVRGA
jgi:hypothetical protein